MFYNTHIHVFRDEDAPNRFLPWPLVPVLRTRIGYFIITNTLKYLWPFSKNDALDRYARFVKISRLGPQKKIFEECTKFYPDNTHFVALAMDMAHMGAGKVKRDYKKQLESLAQVKSDRAVLIPFVHADPRREGITELVIDCIENLGFRGVKIYPSLGYFPYDERLNDIYTYCTNHKIPIITHCSPYNPVHYKGRKKHIKTWLKDAKIPVDYRKKSKKGLCSNFNNPLNWEIVIKKYPQLKICLAHFGSEFYWKKYLDNPDEQNNWFVYVRALIEKYSNLYTDVSFTMNNREFFPLLKVLLENPRLKRKILFGSDYYMVETKATERRFGLDLRAYIGEDLFKTISYDTPRRFLGKNDDFSFY